MNSTRPGLLGWPRRKARAFIEWAMWSRHRFVGVLIGAVAIVGLALTFAITSVAMSVQNAVSAPEASATPLSSPSPWETNKFASKPKPSATTTLAIPPASAGPETAARNFATHWLRGAHIADYSDDRQRWVDELAPLARTSLWIELGNSRQAFMPTATITNAKTIEKTPGMPRGAMVTTFDLSDATILVVETQRDFGDDSPWLVNSYRYKK